MTTSILDPTTPTVEVDLLAADTLMGAITLPDTTGPASVEQVHLSVGDAVTPASPISTAAGFRPPRNSVHRRCLSVDAGTTIT